MIYYVLILAGIIYFKTRQFSYHNIRMSSMKAKMMSVTTRKGNLEPMDISIVRKRMEGLSF